MAKLTDRTELTLPADGDLYVTTDVSDTTDAATGTDKKITWANIKATLKTYFDSLYAAALGADDNYVTDAEKIVIGNTSGTNSGNETTSTLGSTINASSAATPNDTDLVTTVDTSVVKKITWTNVKSFLKTYFDTLYLSLAGGTMTGNITLGENTSIALDPAGSADGKYSGITVTGTAGAALAFGDLCYLDPTDSRWELADANAAAAADGDARGILGICVLAAGADGNATTMLLNGIVRADTAFPALTIGAPVYVSETAGDIVVTQPTTTDVVIRIVGVALTADEIFFNPDFTWTTHT